MKSQKSEYHLLSHTLHGRWISPPCWRDWLLTVISQQILMSISSSWNTDQFWYIDWNKIQGEPKNELYGLWAQICSWSPIWLFRMCLGIRIPSLFHLATSIMLIRNHKCPKTHAQTLKFILSYLKCWGTRTILCMYAHAFLTFLVHLWYLMGIIEVARWNRLGILFP